MTLHQFIHISLVSAFLLISTVKAQAANPVCYVCGGDPTATIGNPEVLIDIPPEYNAPAPQATCQQIYQAGLDNLISAEACDGIELLVDAQIMCGCSNVVASNPGLAPTPTALAAPASVPTELPVPIEVAPSAVDPAETEPPADVSMPNETVPVLPTPLETNPPVTTMPNPVNGETDAPADCKGKGKGKEVSIVSSKGKGGMMMGKKCKRTKEPKTPKAGKGMEGKGKGERLRL
jgi:hypothetical protein